MPRFVVLRHDSPTGVHWDFMLQCGEALRAWALQEEPVADEPGRNIEAVALPDHRTAYLDYEGPVSGDRGQVERWDFGNYRDVETGNQRITADLEGRKLAGRATLVFTGDEVQGRWKFSFSPNACDPYQYGS